MTAQAPHPNPLPARGEREPSASEAGEGLKSQTPHPNPLPARGEREPSASEAGEELKSQAPHPNPLPARGEREPSASEAGEGRRPQTIWPYPRLCAHRGAGKLAPENTLAAFRLGHAHGYRMAEFDVKLSADGIAFLLHDPTLDRTTNAKGRADARTWRELSQLDAGAWHSPAYAGEPLPAFAAVARWSIAHDVAVDIEIKPTPGRERETGAAIALDAATLWAGARVQPLLSSFSEAALEAARDAVPILPRAWIGDRLHDDWRDRAARTRWIALSLKHTLLTRTLVDDIHAAGLRVLTWTVNDPARADELLAWGVDTLVTDAVDLIPAK